MQVIDRYNLSPVTGDVGIEIEMEGGGLSNIRVRNWHFVPDGSLRGNALEYVSSPTVLKNVPRILRELQNQVQEHCRPNPSHRCGVHVHVNCLHLTLEDVSKFAALFYMFEQVLIAHAGEGRKGNLFCLSAADAPEVLNVLKDFRRHGDLSVDSAQRNRYAALNYYALPNHGTLEFRFMSTPGDLTEVGVWPRIFMALRNYAITHDMNNWLLKARKDPKGFFEEVLPEHADMYDEMLFALGVVTATPVLLSKWAPVEKKPKARRRGPSVVSEGPRTRIPDIQFTRNTWFADDGRAMEVPTPEGDF